MGICKRYPRIEYLHLLLWTYWYVQSVPINNWLLDRVAPLAESWTYLRSYLLHKHFQLKHVWRFSKEGIKKLCPFMCSSFRKLLSALRPYSLQHRKRRGRWADMQDENPAFVSLSFIKHRMMRWHFSARWHPHKGFFEAQPSLLYSVILQWTPFITSNSYALLKCLLFYL